MTLLDNAAVHREGAQLKCIYCHQVGSLKCICSMIYCSRECQKKDWPLHSKICKSIHETLYSPDQERVLRDKVQHVQDLRRRLARLQAREAEDALHDTGSDSASETSSVVSSSSKDFSLSEEDQKSLEMYRLKQLKVEFQLWAEKDVVKQAFNVMANYLIRRVQHMDQYFVVFEVIHHQKRFCVNPHTWQVKKMDGPDQGLVKHFYKRKKAGDKSFY
ncbi:hypothetical protein HDV03_002063, partial [Kappamyces sp. JEL0829]